MKCPYCDRRPHQIEEYVAQAKQEKITPEEFVRSEEGTYHPASQLFCCTTCYIRIGMPLNAKLFDAFRTYQEHYASE